MLYDVVLVIGCLVHGCIMSSLVLAMGRATGRTFAPLDPIAVTSTWRADASKVTGRR